MEQHISILNLQNLVKFESSVQRYKVKSNIPLSVNIIDNNRICIEQAGRSFIAFQSEQIVHQLSSRIFKNEINDRLKLSKMWCHSFETDKYLLEKEIETALKNNELTILFYHIKSLYVVYGIVSDAFLPINQLDFREQFLASASQSDNLDLNSKFIKDVYGNVKEQFDFKSEKGRVKLSYVLNYARNNGYHSMRVTWGRIVIVCTNGLTEMRGGDELKFKHLISSSVPDFILSTLNQGIIAKRQTEERIDKAIERNLDKERLADFMNRLHIASVSKERIMSRLKMEVNEVGENEWALSQTLTYLGTHDKHLLPRPKSILKIAGSKIVDESLNDFLNLDTYTTGEERMYGELLPTDFVKSSLIS